MVYMADYDGKTVEYVMYFDDADTSGGDTDITYYTITLLADPSAGGTVSGGGQVVAGETTSITATPNTGYIFLGWYENGVETSLDQTANVAANADRTLTAKFGTDSSGGGSGEMVDMTIDTNTHGSVSVQRNGVDVTNSSNTYTFNVGDTVTLQAVPNSGYEFSSWANWSPIAHLSTSNPYTFTVSADLVWIKALFSALS